MSGRISGAYVTLFIWLGKGALSPGHCAIGMGRTYLSWTGSMHPSFQIGRSVKEFSIGPGDPPKQHFISQKYPLHQPDEKTDRQKRGIPITVRLYNLDSDSMAESAQAKNLSGGRQGPFEPNKYYALASFRSASNPSEVVARQNCVTETIRLLLIGLSQSGLGAVIIGAYPSLANGNQTPSLSGIETVEQVLDFGRCLEENGFGKPNNRFPPGSGGGGFGNGGGITT